MAEPDSTNDKLQAPYFPPPRPREQPSPYRARLPPTYEPPAVSRVVVARASPPDHPWPKLVSPPVPLTLLDRLGKLGAALRVLRVFVGNHPIECFAIAIAILGAYLAALGRNVFSSEFGP